MAVQATRGHRKAASAASLEAVTEGVSKGCVYQAYGHAGDVADRVYRRVAHGDDRAVNERRRVAEVLDPAKAHLLRTSSGAGLNKMSRFPIAGGPFAAVGGILGFTGRGADGHCRTG